ncbi:hypothetical protein XENOCAPTIV_022112 [Xenoophorus captivus]|uniref:Uncharacterized protein n=1 Tax=Xenoophorus captivus TaxID=1517983 RepID=A0ABV0R5R1_9TELE
MSNRVVCREASHAGSWYSASGNCQHSTVCVRILHVNSCFCFLFSLTVVCLIIRISLEKSQTSLNIQQYKQPLLLRIDQKGTCSFHT